ncbi:hypothetical protein [Mycobacterium syngnathidarum]|uniref:Uncharacterized protein n=1 Tax=Mycobacterium syngnathidarum TaxID=1908205 RepID=A0A1S1K4Y3_9MYCO|nr:hypothetical protein [Mycobacterium syngnathidarum]OHT97234.1 hypothetical protein BKG61_16980 [Mycobacterium syngnathidarum]
MNHPYGPYGQGIPQQAGYPQPAGWSQQPGWPQQSGYPPSGYPGYPQPKLPGGPSGATGILAGILALLGGLAGLCFSPLSVVTMVSDHAFDIVGAVVVLFGAGFGLALFIGAILLFRRNMNGRRLVIGGCGLAILTGLAVLAEQLTKYDFDGGAVLTIAVPLFVFPILTLVLTMLPPTARWIRAKPSPVAVQYQPPYPAY